MATLDYFLSLKLENAGKVKGEATGKDCQDDIIIESFHWGETSGKLVYQRLLGVSHSDDRTTARIHESTARLKYAEDRLLVKGELAMEDFFFRMKTNKASPVLMLGCAMNDIVQEAVLKCCRDTSMGKQVFMTWTLLNGVISSYRIAGTTEDVLPLDEFSIEFSTIGVEYRSHTIDRMLGPPVCAKYDLPKNKPG